MLSPNINCTSLSFATGTLPHRTLSSKTGKVVAILDWEMLGWYSELWEPVMFHLGCHNQTAVEVMKEIFGELDDLTVLFITGMTLLFDPSLGRLPRMTSEGSEL